MKRVLITRPRRQAPEFAEALEKAGFEPVFFPVIEIAPADPAPIDSALRQLDSYDWLVLTSANGVMAVLGRLEVLGIRELPENLQIAVIGPKTAEALRSQGCEPDFIPSEYIAEAILPGLGDLDGNKILLARADIARQALTDAIREAGGTAHEVTAYRTLPAELDQQGLDAIRQGIDAVTLTSSSTARNFAALMKQNCLDPLNLPGNPIYACIGPITAATAREEGLPVHIMAEEYTTEGLVAALVNMLLPAAEARGQKPDASKQKSEISEQIYIDTRSTK